MKKVEKFKIFSDEIPENMGTVRKKILFLLHKHGMIEQAPFMIEGVSLATIRFTKTMMLNKKLIKNIGGFISLTESGLEMYANAVKSEVMVNVSLDRVMKELKKAQGAISTRQITSNIFGEDNNGQHRYRVQVILKKLHNEGIVVVHSVNITAKFYVLSDTLSGKELIAAQAVQEKYKETPPYIFQTILTGGLTGGDTKKGYLY